MIHGVIVVRKEKGMTSFSVVARLRRIFGQKKIGHTGTLDPDAEGVLPVCFGRGTRLVDTLMKGTKTYEAVLLLGITTDTQDAGGTVLSEHPVDVDEGEIREAILSMGGPQLQMPPMYSAIKVNGKKLVDLARKGIEVERKPREVEFSEMEVLWVRKERAAFRVTCTHGAYIRTLCSDIGGKLGCGAVMESLVRTRVGEFGIGEALTLDEIEARKAGEDAEGRYPYSFVRGVDSFFADCPALHLGCALSPAILSGGPVPFTGLSTDPSALQKGTRCRVYADDGSFLGIYEKRRDQMRLVTYFYEDH